MPQRKRKPTSPGRRFQTVADFSELTKSHPERSLVEKKPATGGRNNYGRKTARHRGGGHKRRYRVVVVGEWGFEAPKTQEAVTALDALGTEGRVLIVAERTDVNTWRSFANLGRVHVVSPGELNAYDVLVSDWVIFTKRTLPGSTLSSAVGADEFDGSYIEEAS